MCDYSLIGVRSRPAKVGDELTTRDFGTCTRGFAAAEDRGRAGAHARSLGQGVPRDLIQAYAWFARAEKAGVDPLGYYLPPYSYATGQVLAQVPVPGPDDRPVRR